MSSPADLSALRARWAAAWPEALAAWSRFTRLRDPQLCLSSADAAKEGLTMSFAMIRLTDQAVIVDLEQIAQRGLEDYAREILAHEIGHHVYAPASLSDHGRMIARMRWALPTVEKLAGMVANLYTDLLINDRLQRSAGFSVADIYQKLIGGPPGAAFGVYLRIYEVLWNKPRGSLGSGKLDDRAEGDAWLGARLVRSYARDHLRGAGSFAALMLPYLLEDKEAEKQLARLFDMSGAGAGGDPSGLTEEDPDERGSAVHPALDPNLTGEGDLDAGEPAASGQAPPSEQPASKPSGGQAREPFQYGEILRALGLNLSDHDVAVRYYRERARPHLVPFPSRRLPQSQDPLPEGLEPWDFGHPLDSIDWLQTVLQSPRVIAGLTTVQRTYGTSEGREPKRQPIDLDLYVDSSGSMLDPRRNQSFPTLAGAILCLSALRAGARVQATLWSGKNQYLATDGFVRDEEAILRVLTGYYGGGTQFPLHVLRKTWIAPKLVRRRAHILVISDDGASTMLDSDEKGVDGADVCARSLARAAGGGTLVLNLRPEWESWGRGKSPDYAKLLRLRDELGFDVFRITDWAELVAFARAFARKSYVDQPAPG